MKAKRETLFLNLVLLKYSTAYLPLNQIFKDFIFLNYCIIHIQLLTLDDFFRSFQLIPLRNSKGKSIIFLSHFLNIIRRRKALCHFHKDIWLGLSCRRKHIQWALFTQAPVLSSKKCMHPRDTSIAKLTTLNTFNFNVIFPAEKWHILLLKTQGSICSIFVEPNITIFVRRISISF